MKAAHAVFLTLITLTCLNAQVSQHEESNLQPAPEIQKLYEALGGDWDTHEMRERTQFFPSGGERRGRTRIRLAAGGAMLVMEGHSDGSAGPLSYIIVIWWDKEAGNYGYFTCFKDTESGCKIRGAAHWDDDKFVNDYYETVDGKKLKFRDTFKDIASNSYTLDFSWVKDDGSTEPVIISKSVRHLKNIHP